MGSREGGMEKWDGKIKYIRKSGEFKIGLVGWVYKRCIEVGIKGMIVDMREGLGKVSKVVSEIGKYKLRGEEEKGVKGMLCNKVGERGFEIGVLDYRVNGGKRVIMCGLYLWYKKELKSLVIRNECEWLNEGRDEFKEYVGGEDIRFVEGKVLKWSNFSIGMVECICGNMKYYENEVGKIDMVLMDEGEEGGSKEYENVMSRLFNRGVRMGLCGRIYMSKVGKDKVKNMNLGCLFGDVIGEFKVKEWIKKGYWRKRIVKRVEGKGWFGNWEWDCMWYNEIYDDWIRDNKIGWRMGLDRLKWKVNEGRYGGVVVCKDIGECENVWKLFKKKVDIKYNIGCVDVNSDSKLREEIMKDFREGKIDMVVWSRIIGGGKKFGKVRYVLNSGSMDCEEKWIELLGGLVRKDEWKWKV